MKLSVQQQRQTLKKQFPWWLSGKESVCHEWIRKPWYIYTMEYYSAIKKNSFESVLMRWMKLEPIIQSEVSQKDKEHYSILTHIHGIQKYGNDNPICKIEKETQMYRTEFWTLWEKNFFKLLNTSNHKSRKLREL